MHDLVNILKSFGLTQIESKVFLGLYNAGICTGYEVSKISGVDRSKVYTALESLCDRGIVLQRKSAASNLYLAETKNNLIEILKSEMKSKIDQLNICLPNFPYTQNKDFSWNISSYNSFYIKLKEIILSAKSEICIQIWSEELTDEIEKLIIDKKNSGIKTLVILYDAYKKYKSNIPNIFIHGFEEEKLAEFNSRWLNLCVDNDKMLYGTVRKDITAGIFTDNPSMVFFAKEYILHDAYCLKLISYIDMDKKENIMNEISEVF